MHHPEDALAAYETITRGIRISVEPDFLEEESDPADDHYVWAYTVRIDNDSDEVVTLQGRLWHITDADGQTVTVKGDGVVGEQPHLKPGEGFQYTSGTMLETSMGTMGGSYVMITDDGAEFRAPIEDFLLSAPRTLH